MKDIDAIEAAYRNGYEAGKAELVGKTEQLEEAVGRMAIELAAVKKERDAAVADVKLAGGCLMCKKFDTAKFSCSLPEPECAAGGAHDVWEWSGIDE